MRYFIIAGERRCGTTSLMTTLAQHPEICLQSKRDRAWFVDDTVKCRPDGARRQESRWEDTHDIADYLAWLQETCAPTHPVIGEKSADYLFWRPAHARIGRMLPDVRLLVVLRDPVKRAWSHYWNEVAKRRERLPFYEALYQEEARLARSDWHKYNFSYLARGDYAASLSHLFRHIPRDQVLVITLEGFIAHQQETLASICRFLGVCENFIFRKEQVNSNANWAVVHRPGFTTGPRRLVADTAGAITDTLVNLFVRKREARRHWRMKMRSPFFMPAKQVPMPRDVEVTLRAHFRPRVRALEELLGRKFAEWDM